MIARRGILQLIGLAPAAPIATRAILEGALRSVPATALATAAIAGSSIPGPENEKKKILGNLVWDQLQNLKRRHELEYWSRNRIAQGQIDPDLASLKSISAVRKAQIQAARDRDYEDLQLRVERLLW